VSAVVSKRETLLGAERPRRRVHANARGQTAQIRLAVMRSVYEQQAVFQRDALARQANDSLYPEFWAAGPGQADDHDRRPFEGTAWGESQRKVAIE